MVYPVELAVGVIALAVGYLLHYNYPIVDSSDRRTETAGAALSPTDPGLSRRSVVVEQAAGATLFLFGLVLVIDGLGF